MNEYQLHTLVDSKGFVLACIKKGMYGLLQPGMLANKLLKEQLGPMAIIHVSAQLGYGDTTINQSSSHS
jgi:hypothetical protein